MNPTQHDQTHDLLWDNRLQDCLDDHLDRGDRAVLESHLSGCSQCCNRRDELRRVDEALHAWLGRPGLDESFDRRVLALIDGPAAV